ncbi:hypothetical protein ACS5NO_32240 [Larkinella sp. GY13]|uniref:hypothetical protein n=1 Tax=Larkinella sp. GY13 TaxID=3453720 RepID=UPI003EEFFA89
MFFGLREYVDGAFINSMLGETSGALVWTVGSFLFASLGKILCKISKAAKKAVVKAVTVKSFKFKNAMKTVKFKEVKNLIPGMFVVATVLENEEL